MNNHPTKPSPFNSERAKPKTYFAGCFYIWWMMILGSCTCVIGQEVPQTEAEWQQWGNQLFSLYGQQDFPGIVRQADTVGWQHILAPPGHYLSKVCIADGLAREERYADSLDFYEGALVINPRSVDRYANSIRWAGEFDRGLTFLRKLEYQHPKDAAQIEAAETYIKFFSTVAEGDAKYLKGDKDGALALYQQARQQYDTCGLPQMNADQQRDFAKGFTSRWDEYTYLHAYDAPDGAIRMRYLLSSFLDAKMALCKYVAPESAQPVTLKAAVLIVRNTAFSCLASNRTIVEKAKLDGSGWERRREAWIFATDAVQMYSGGKIKIKTTYVDLPNVTVAKVDDSVWHGMIHVRHLLPSGLKPSQAALFEELAPNFDLVIFAWNGGSQAIAYGGGSDEFPGLHGRLPSRGCVRRMPLEAGACLHELLHNFENHGFADKVHGPQGVSWDVEAKELNLHDEVDWYGHLLAEIKDPESLRYLP